MASAEGDVGAGCFAGLEGATVVVVGASSGMGLATATAAAAAGADVVIVARDPGRLDAARAVDRRVDPRRSRSMPPTPTPWRRCSPSSEQSITSPRSRASSHRARSPTRPTSSTSAPSTRGCGRPATCALSAAPRMPAGGSFTFCSGLSAWRPRPLRAAGAAATGGARVVRPRHGGRAGPDQGQHRVPRKADFMPREE